MGMNAGVKIGKMRLKNPVMAASGTFGLEYKDLVDINSLGAIVMKTITLKPRQGNPPPRLVETAAGMLNSIGLENIGLERFIKEKLPKLEKLRTNVIVSIAAEDADELAHMAGRFDKTKIDAIELNLSCPNLKTSDYRVIAQDPEVTYRVVKAVREATKRTLIAKLSPNVTDITEIALAAEGAGADGVSLVNTFSGMAVDIENRTPKLGNITGGLSGPAIKPLALRMVWEAFNKVKIPIIGIGGIIDYDDAIEFIICGATAVQVGTANFVNPKATVEIIEGIEEYLKEQKIKDIKKLVGSLKVNG